MLQETIKKLNEIKEYIDYNKAYTDMINTAIYYDNEMQDDLYLHDIVVDYGFCDEELVNYLLENIGNDITRLRYFIGDTMSDDIYIVNDYGDLENVSMDDIIMCIDELLEMLEEAKS